MITSNLESKYCYNICNAYVYNSCVSGSVVARLGEIAEQHWGLFTTAEAAQANVSRVQLGRLNEQGAISRVIQGVYRMAGTVDDDRELIRATWLALGGYTAAQPVPPVVAAGTTAADLHEIGDFIPDTYDFIVPARKGTRRPGVRFRVRQLTRGEISFVDQIPALTIERTIADLVELWTDLSLVADALRDAVTQGRLVGRAGLVTYLAPLARDNGHPPGDGQALAHELYEIAGLT